MDEIKALQIEREKMCRFRVAREHLRTRIKLNILAYEVNEIAVHRFDNDLNQDELFDRLAQYFRQEGFTVRIRNDYLLIGGWNDIKKTQRD